MKAGLKRQKSVSSQAASISAWWTVFDWLSIVAALTVARHGPASSSAARRNMAARSSQGVGELWLEDERLVHHELPVAGLAGGPAHPLGERFAAYFSGEDVSFEDVEL